jgi:hypothetical protein
MSLYNMVNGVNPLAEFLLSAINLDLASIPRFRDVWLSTDLASVVVLTRTGGGNREDYEVENAAMAAHPGYLGDADDDFDSTFAKFRYTMPPEKLAEIQQAIETADISDEVREWFKGQLTMDNAAKWKASFEALGADFGGTIK